MSTSNQTLTDTFTQAEKPKRTFATWVGVGMLVGMGTLCGAMAVGGLYFAVTMIATKPAAAFGGLMMAGAVGYVLPYITTGINELINPGSLERAKTQKQAKPGLARRLFRKKGLEK